MQTKTVRYVKVFVLAALSLYATFVAAGNLMDFNSNYEFVKHVLSMDTTFPNNDLMWRAVTSEPVHLMAYWGIILTEIAIAVVGWMGVYKMCRALKGSAVAFAAAKTVGYYAFMLAILLWFVGFIDFGSEWFAMWQSDTWNGKQTAMDITEVVLGMLIVYMLPEPAVAKEKS